MIFTTEHQKIPRRFSTMAWAAVAHAVLLIVIVAAWPRAGFSSAARPETAVSAPIPRNAARALGLAAAPNARTVPFGSSHSPDPSISYPPRAFNWTGVYSTNGTQPAQWASTRVWLIPAVVETTRRSIEDSIFNHLWQSTLFAALIGMIAVVLRRKEARVRYWLWCAASVKFLIPIVALKGIGGVFPLGAAASPPPTPTAIALAHIAEPFSRSTLAAIGTTAVGSASEWWWPTALWIAWFLGAEFVAIRRIKAWRRVRDAASGSRPAKLAGVALPDGVSVRSSATLFEPGTIGLLKPVLLLPEGIESHLTRAELQTVIDHEACHLRCRDNLTAGIHMLIEAVFWFHPLVWWIGARMVDERERACDEHVVAAIDNPRTYAEAILRVCQRYFDAELASVPGVGGGDLRRRMVRIMNRDTGAPVSAGVRAWLAAAAAFVVVIPVGIGAFTTAARAPQDAQPLPARQAFDIVSIKPFGPDTQNGYRLAPGRFTAGITVRELIAIASVAQGRAPARGQIVGLPDWADSSRFAIDAKVVSLDSGWNTTVGIAFGRTLAPYVRSLLEDRFKLVTHAETRQLPVYALTIARADGRLGPHLRVSSLTPNDCRARLQHPETAQGLCGTRNSGNKFTSTAQPLASVIAFAAQGRLDRDVIDQTGLTGLFDAEFERDDSVAIFTDVQEQFGLKLEPARESREVLVIDHIEKPTPD